MISGLDQSIKMKSVVSVFPLIVVFTQLYWQVESYSAPQNTGKLHDEKLLNSGKPLHRAKFLKDAQVMAAFSFTSTFFAPKVEAMSLRDKIKQRSFDKPIFNRPPGEAEYPEWLLGEWDVVQNFGGYLFPNKNIPKEKVVADEDVPGFKQLSIIMLPDIGKETFTYKKRFIERNGVVVEDRPFNFANQIDKFCGRATITAVDYEPERNPNRMSLSFNPTNKKNVQRIELFANARDAQLVDENTFLQSEYLRQVTFYIPNLSGVVLQIIADYQNFWVYRKNPQDSSVQVSLLTAGYLQPQDALFFDSPTQPVVLYSHQLALTKKKLNDW